MSYKYILLQDICEKASSNITQKELIENEGTYPIYGASGFIKNVDFFQQEKEYIAIVKDGAGIGRAMKLPAKSSVIGTMQYIIPKDNINISYLYYAICSMHLEKYFSGATIPHIYFRDYKNEKLPLPPLEVQLKIAAIFENLEHLIENKNKQLISLDKLAKSRFIEMFGQKNYPLVKASDVCDFITKGTTPKREEIYGTYSNDRIPFLKVYNLSSTGKLLFKDKAQYIDKTIHNSSLSRSIVFPNDVLMNIVGPPLGKFAIVDDSFPEWNINQAIAIFRAKEKIIPLYLMYSLMQDEILTPFLQQAVGIRQLNISLEQCRELQIKLPPLKVQCIFSEFTKKVDKSKFTS